MTKPELIQSIKHDTGISSDTIAKVIETAISTIIAKVSAGEQVSIKEFGVFEMHNRAERKGHSIQNNMPIIIEAHKLPYFRASRIFKEAVNK